MISPQLIDTDSWRMLTEIARHHPGRFRIAEMHPVAQMYDCLALLEHQDRGTITMSYIRTGTVA